MKKAEEGAKEKGGKHALEWIEEIREERP